MRAAVGAAERSIENDGDYIWGGNIRDVRIYDNALSSSQILDIVNENKSSSNICSL